MTWFVASLRDHDTHQATDLTEIENTVTARCGHEFRPLTRLRGTPPDPPADLPDMRTTTIDRKPMTINRSHVPIGRDKPRRPKGPLSYDPLPVFQLAGERERLVVTGRRTDDEERCELLVIADLSGSFALYPHGVDRFGVRLECQAAVQVALAILAAAGSAPAEQAPGEG